MESLGGKPILDLLTEIGGWPAINDQFNVRHWNFQRTIQITHNQLNMGGFFSWVVAEDDKNSSRHVIQVSIFISIQMIVKTHLLFLLDGTFPTELVFQNLNWSTPNFSAHFIVYWYRKLIKYSLRVPRNIFWYSNPRLQVIISFSPTFPPRFHFITNYTVNLTAICSCLNNFHDSGKLFLDRMS